MKQVAGTLRLDLAQYREMAAFAQFASDLDKSTQQQLARGERLVEVLKQPQYKPQPFEKQVLIIYAATNGFVDHLPKTALSRYEKELFDFIESKHPRALETIRTKKQIDDETKALLKTALTEFNKVFAL
jgi:F-type H+-transporting ATPase subunit alpha